MYFMKNFGHVYNRPCETSLAFAASAAAVIPLALKMASAGADSSLASGARLTARSPSCPGRIATREIPNHIKSTASMVVMGIAADDASAHTKKLVQKLKPVEKENERTGDL